MIYTTESNLLLRDGRVIAECVTVREALYLRDILNDERGRY